MFVRRAAAAAMFVTLVGALTSGLYERLMAGWGIEGSVLDVAIDRDVGDMSQGRVVRVQMFVRARRYTAFHRIGSGVVSAERATVVRRRSFRNCG